MIQTAAFPVKVMLTSFLNFQPSAEETYLKHAVRNTETYIFNYMYAHNSPETHKNLNINENMKHNQAVQPEAPACYAFAYRDIL